MKNETTKLKRGDNCMPNQKMPIPKQRRNPPLENRVRFENIKDSSRPRVPRQPTPNAVVLDDVCDEKSTEKEGNYLPNKCFEIVHGWMQGIHVHIWRWRKRS
jgi:hypothetical protein